MVQRGLIVIVLAAFLLAWPARGSAQVAADSPRRTALVEVVETCSPAVVDIFGLTPIKGQPGSASMSVGTGSVLHESGYIVTNAHVAETDGEQTVSLHDGTQLPYRVICEYENEDLAIIKVDSDEPLTAMTLGRSDDLMLGESVIVIGNPGGLAHTVTSGIVSATGRVTGTDDGSYLADTIQTDAAINGGNSGGPLINMAGEQIGVVVAKRMETEGLGFAIPVDRLRAALPEMVASPMRCGYAAGMTVDAFGPAVVQEIAADGAADQAGVHVGDTITEIDGMNVRDGVHYYLGLAERQAGEELALTVLRDGTPLAIELTLREVEPIAACDVSREGLAQGLQMQVFEGQWERLPEFNTLDPVATHLVPEVSLAVGVEHTEQFGLVFTGYLDVPETGVYTFHVTSDDGAQLFISDRLVVDNDGLHAAIENSGVIRLEQGLHPIRSTFFERGGDEVLQVDWSGPDIARQPLSAEFLFTVQNASQD